MQKPTKSLKDAIIELYLNVKLRSKEEIADFTEEVFEKEKQSLRKVDSFTVLDYIRSSVEIIMNLKLEGETSHDSKRHKGNSTLYRSEQSLAEPPKDYESMLQKLEAEVRNHIRVQQQLKLHIECMQSKMEEVEKQHMSKINELTEEIKRLHEKLAEKENVLKTQQKEIIAVNGYVERYKKQVVVLNKKCEAAKCKENALKISKEGFQTCRTVRNELSTAGRNDSKARVMDKTNVKVDKGKTIASTDKDIMDLRKRLNSLQTEIVLRKSGTRIKGKTLAERSHSISGVGTIYESNQRKIASITKNTSEQLRYVLSKKSTRSSSEMKKRPPSIKMRPSTASKANNYTGKS